MTGLSGLASDERLERAALWCMRLADAPLSAEEQSDFNAWMAAESANAQVFEAAMGVWQGVETIAASPEMIRYRADAVETLRQLNARRWSRAFLARFPASVAVCLLMLVFLVIGYVHQLPTRYETAVGERRTVTLEDGSRMTLDGASVVEVRREGGPRSLALRAGRARFEVAYDPLRPFSVRVGNHVMVAAGAFFSVEKLPEELRVVLHEGRMEVIDRAGIDKGPPPVSRDLRGNGMLPERREAGVVLTPGKALIASTAGAQVRVVDADLALSNAWESGRLGFENEALVNAVERMNRHARLRLVIADARVASYRISGTFEAGDVEAFVARVTELHPVAVLRRPGELILTSRD